MHDLKEDQYYKLKKKRVKAKVIQLLCAHLRTNQPNQPVFRKYTFQSN